MNEEKNLANKTTIVRGRYYDGQTEAAGVAKKINDILTAATSVQFVSVSKSGQELVAVICWKNA